MEEVWKNIIGYEKLYKISNTGKVYSLITHKIMAGNLRSGYKNVQLSKNGSRKNFQIHRLVAVHFIDNPNNLPIVNHIDYCRTNNSVENLEWVTQKENVRHSICNMVGKNHICTAEENYGICYRYKQKIYEVWVKTKYGGRFKDIQEARAKRDEMLNEINITK